jgi:hypothetical protein
MRWRFLALIALLACRVAGGETAVSNRLSLIKPQPEVVQNVRCSDCHTRPNPTKTDPALVPCPRFAREKGPDVVLIDQLSAQYVPVIFAHKLHAQMTEMTGGCAACHHFNPSHKILPCRECHSGTERENLAKPGLRGAYHRQCLNCHREWSHETDCVVCHARKTASSAAVVLPDPTDIMGILHPNAEQPVIKTYRTKHEPGRLVTFRHQDHVRRYGFRCVNCHREQNCSRCHKPENGAVQVKTLKEHHSPCAACHETGEDKPELCSHCHADEATPPFRHDKTGLVLDENHQDAACRDCHEGSQFDRKPTCSECHEEKDKITYPEKLPGKRVNKS